ncbi:MAG: hypothetical protein AAB947_01940 [Patescibacteria group bacterium]
MDKNIQALLEGVNFIKERMATREDVHEIVNEAVDSAKVELRAEIHEVVNKAVNAAKVELRSEIHETASRTNERLADLERGQEEILDVLRPLSRAHSTDALTIVGHETRITRIERQLAIH